MQNVLQKKTSRTFGGKSDGKVLQIFNVSSHSSYIYMSSIYLFHFEKSDGKKYKKKIIHTFKSPIDIFNAINNRIDEKDPVVCRNRKRKAADGKKVDQRYYYYYYYYYWEDTRASSNTYMQTWWYNDQALTDYAISPFYMLFIALHSGNINETRLNQSINHSVNAQTHAHP